jgi:ankyrin repeat protein
MNILQFIINLLPLKGHTCFHHAAIFGHVAIVKLLWSFSSTKEMLGFSSLVNKRDPSGMSALHLSVYFGI